MTHTELPSGWTLVHPTPDDLDRVTDYLIAFDLAASGQADTTRADVEYEWSREGFRLAEDAWMLLTPESRIAGYCDLWLDGSDLYISPNTNILPKYLEQVSPEVFYRLAIEKARPMKEVCRLKTISMVESSEPILLSLGFEAIQVQWRMEIRLKEAPPVPVWSAGYHLRPFDREQDAREVFEVIETAFQELPHRHGNTFEGWENFILERSDFEPELLKVVEKEGEICACAIGFDAPIGGWVRQLAVKKAHRGHGLAINLLHQLFGEFHARGRDNVGLTVDSENRTGAPEVYQRAGMSPMQKFVTYVKNNPSSVEG